MFNSVCRADTGGSHSSSSSWTEETNDVVYSLKFILRRLKLIWRFCLGLVSTVFKDGVLIGLVSTVNLM